jgi:hypothetical protein
VRGSMNFLPIAASDMDVIIGIIAVIGWIVAQVMGKKKAGDKTEPTPGETALPTDPQDELRKFFEEMEKTLKPAEQPRTVPPPPLPTPRPHPKPRWDRPVATQSHAVESVPAYPPSLQSAQEAARVFMKAAERAAAVPTIPTVPKPTLVLEGFHDRLALRKMIVTMEVLGKPVALRSA